ncbi:hypothetical protein BRC81_03055 [Halobacteriales archaeon QS_1_68_20]|nr:MAG: hypothetical protein BRC81_03055 [Halobacteriales archaeon QS_1_68_20]
MLACVEQNTGWPEDPQPATITPARVALHLVAHGSHNQAGIDRAIQAALEQGDLVALDVDGERRLVRADPEALKAVIGEQNCRDDPDLEVIEQAVAALEGVGR